MKNKSIMKSTISQILLLSILTVMSCNDSKSDNYNITQIENLKVSIDSLKNELVQNQATKKNEIATFLTFQDNNAESAMSFYVALFDNSNVVSVKRWGEGGPGEEGRIMHAIFSLNGNLFMCSDSPAIHDWDFSPAVSNYIECKNESELVRLFTKLSENGNVTMPLNNYGFSQKFGWVIDQFGISWQLNLS